MLKHIATATCVLALCSSPLYALERIQISAAHIDLPQGITLTQTDVTLDRLSGTAPVLRVTVGGAASPKPFLSLSQIDLHCPALHVSAARIACDNGQLRFRHTARRYGFDWRFNAAPQRIDFRFDSGRRDFGRLRGEISGHAQAWRADLQLTAFSLQSTEGDVALDRLDGTMTLTVEPQLEDWRWQMQLALPRGEGYLAPVYWPFSALPIDLHAQAYWQARDARWTFENITLKLAQQAQLTARGHWQAPTGFSGHVHFRGAELAPLFQYLALPWLPSDRWQEAALHGAAEFQAVFRDDQLDHWQLRAAGVSWTLPRWRLAVEGLYGDVRGSRTALQSSSLGWRALELYGLPFGSTHLAWQTQGTAFQLLRPARLPLFDGAVLIKHWQGGWENDTPWSDLTLALEALPLPELTATLNWPLLSGRLVGELPGLRYRDGALTLAGEWWLDAFDGAIHLQHLRIDELLGENPRLRATLTWQNLDLAQLTGPFSFGHIEGRLSGYLRDLLLENWQAVAFDAWLGTPPNDRSRRRISQKAVNNLANLGGGGASDVISRGVLQLFDNFPYSRLGWGCQLRGGVCRMTGVNSAPNGGFYLLEGSGLPRIDVIGYHAEVDWPVLLRRLHRVLQTDSAIVR